LTSPRSSVSHHPLYGLWKNMIGRCHSPSHPAYHRYGGRGISVCKRWRGKGGFQRFAADMGPRPTSKHSVERMNNNKGYSPSNCKWATKLEQGRNKRNNRLLTFDGKTQCVAAWAAELGITSKFIDNRLRLSWTVDRILSTPIILGRMLTFNGKTQSVAAWARTLGISRLMLNTRLQLGWTVEKALTHPVQRRDVTFRGRTQSLSDWARELNILRSTLESRLHCYGWSVQRAFTTPARSSTHYH
jgi:hypothetical protein